MVLPHLPSQRDLEITEKKALISCSSRQSSIPFNDGKFSERSYSTIESTSLLCLLTKPRVSLRRPACRHLRGLYKRKSSAVVITKPTFDDLQFSYAVFPSAPALQGSAQDTRKGSAAATALIIDCNDHTNHIQQTLECALQTFSRENIFVVGNSNSDYSNNDTSKTCAWFGVRYIWIPSRSKVTAQYVGVAAARRFHYCLLIDGDVALSPHFPILIDWIDLEDCDENGLQSPVKCVGYATEPTRMEDLQMHDLRYRLSDLPESFFSKTSEGGSASFPHGAISLWDRSLLEKCFHRHPGHRASPNWFLGINLALFLEKKSNE